MFLLHCYQLDMLCHLKMEFATESGNNKIHHHLRQLKSVSMESKALLIYKLPCHQMFVVDYGDHTAVHSGVWYGCI